MDISTRKKLGKLVLNRIKSIEVVSVQTAKVFSSNKVAIPAFREIVNNAKVPVDDKENEQFLNGINQVMDDIYNVCEKFANDNLSKFIPIIYIKTAVNKSIEAFKSGFES